MNNPLTDPYIVLDRVYGGGAYLKQALSEAPVDRRRLSLTTRVCYGVLEKDVYLDYVIAANCARRPKRQVALIMKIALYMNEFMGKKAYMTADNAVELLKKTGRGALAPFLNAFLRNYAVPPLPEGGVKRLSVEASAPEWLCRKVRRAYGGEAEAVLTAPSPGVSVRFVRGREAYAGVPHEDTPFGDVSLFRNFARDPGYDRGDYTFQSLGSVAVCDAVEGCPRLLDACAAPGGKSVLLAAKCGEVVAEEIHPHRVSLIESYRDRMGVGNVTAECGDARVFNPAWEGAFDAVLCDVPCSGVGVINENPDIKLFRAERDLAGLKATQADILSNCSRYVRAGGSLYYSTCSYLPEENDSAVYGFLDAHPSFVRVPLSSPLAHRDTRFGMQFLPHISSGAGFYVSRMVRGT